MMTIKVIKNNNVFETRTNGTLSDVAERYLLAEDGAKEIEVLHGGEEKTECYIKTPLKIYRASKEEIERFQLLYKIRCIYSIYYKDTGNIEEISCGLI